MNDDLRICQCGSAWFRLRAGTTDAGLVAGVVSINQAGDVIAYSAIVECMECGDVVESDATTPPMGDASPTPLRLVR